MRNALNFQKYINNPFFAGSVIMILGTNIYNVGQFIYHIVAAKILGKVYYGDLAALINILGIFSLIQISLSLTIVKFIASESDEKKINGIVHWANRISILAGLGVMLLIAVFAAPISNFLHLSQLSAVYFLAPVIFLYAIAGVTRSVLQGLLKFGWYVSSLLSEVIIKLIIMIPLVFGGYAVSGALGALIVGVLCSVILGVISLKRYIFAKDYIQPNVTPLLKYSLPAFLQGVALTSMYSTDLFLVKHFFSPEQAGLYAGLAKLGTIVFFGASPVANVMFPIVAKKHSHGESYHQFFYLSALLIVAISGIAVFCYFLFPEIFLSALGPSFLEGSPILWWFGAYMGLLSLGSLFIQFYLSIGKTRIVGLFILAAILQANLIWLFHESLVTVVQMSIISATLLVLSLLLYFPYHEKKKK